MALSGTTVAVPAIAAQLGGGGLALQWIVTGYFLAASCLILIAGSTADQLGRRLVFRFGAVCYTVGAAGSAMAPGIVILDLARTVSGIGSACLMAAAGALLGSVFTGSARTRAFAAVGTTVGLGLAAGPTLAGLLVSGLGWRAMFGGFAAVGLVVLATTLRMPESTGRRTPVDLLGAGTYVVGMVGLIGGTLQAADLGWTHSRVCGALAVGAAAITLFVRRQHGNPRHVLDVSLLRPGPFLGWLLAGTLLALGTLGALIHVPTYLQGAAGFTAGHAGVTMLALTAPIALLPPLAARLVDHHVAPVVLLGASAVLLAGGNLWLTHLDAQPAMLSLLGPLLAIGSANGLLTGLVDPQALRYVTDTRLGMASGVLNTVRAAGNTVTLTVFAAVLIGFLQTHTDDRRLAGQIAAGHPISPPQILAYTTALHHTFLAVAAACGVLGLLACYLTTRSPSPARLAEPGRAPTAPSLDDA